MAASIPAAAALLGLVLNTSLVQHARQPKWYWPDSGFVA
jgi:hypothetical protein